jgi:tetratricopeptide (TPR) repeat protein
MALVDAYIEAGNCAGALDVVEDLSVALRREPRINARAARCYALQGDYVKASKIYEDVVENTLPSRGTLIYAQLALSLGQVEDAIDMMEREVENSAWTQFLIRRYFAHNDALKTHPRFLALLKSIGLDDESVAKLD